jgi:1-acyl-sn-glycerol-3-phosphate acyltransferase
MIQQVLVPDMDLVRSIVGWFIAICLIGILFPVAFLMWVVTLPFDRERWITHWILVFQSILILSVIPVGRIRIEGRKKAIRGTTYVVISNHQSILDILLVNCLRYRYKWISKIENMKVPAVGWYLKMAGYITVDRGNDESKAAMREKSLACLQRGCSIMLFPEGTRSQNGEIGFFKRGAFQLAMQAEVPILPVVLDGTSDILPKHGFRINSGHRVRMRVLDPIKPSDFETTDPDVLALNVSNMMRSELHSMKQEKMMQ